MLFSKLLWNAFDDALRLLGIMQARWLHRAPLAPKRIFDNSIKYDRFQSVFICDYHRWHCDLLHCDEITLNQKCAMHNFVLSQRVGLLSKLYAICSSSYRFIWATVCWFAVILKSYSPALWPKLQLNWQQVRDSFLKIYSNIKTV